MNHVISDKCGPSVLGSSAARSAQARCSPFGVSLQRSFTATAFHRDGLSQRFLPIFSCWFTDTMTVPAKFYTINTRIKEVRENKHFHHLMILISFTFFLLFLVGCAKNKSALFCFKSLFLFLIFLFAGNYHCPLSLKSRFSLKQKSRPPKKCTVGYIATPSHPVFEKPCVHSFFLQE